MCACVWRFGGREKKGRAHSLGTFAIFLCICLRGFLGGGERVRKGVRPATPVLPGIFSGGGGFATVCARSVPRSGALTNTTCTARGRAVFLSMGSQMFQAEVPKRKVPRIPLFRVPGPERDNQNASRDVAVHARPGAPAG